MSSPGEPNLPHAGRGGTVRLDSRVLVDWELFERLRQRGTDEDLRAALALVRGRPFQDVPYGHYSWLAETFLEHEAASAIVAASHAVTEDLMRRQDFPAARDAVRIGQTVDRYDERLWFDQLTITAEVDGPSGVRAIFERYSDLMHRDGDEPNPELVAAARRLIGRDGGGAEKDRRRPEEVNAAASP